jgi:hypothetical protein
MDALNKAVYTAMSGYARSGLNSHSYLIHSDDNMILSIVTVPKGKSGAFVSLLVRIVAETVIIERDQNDKPLVDALVQTGIPRSRIILAYAGEPVPESA